MKRTRMRRQGPRGRRRQAALATLRPLILARAGGRCENPLCRKRVRLDLHHIVKRSQGGREDGNLLALCRRCHDRTDLPIIHPQRLTLLFDAVGRRVMFVTRETSMVLALACG